MGSLKYDKELCSDVMTELGKIGDALDRATQELSEYYASLPESGAVRERAKSLSIRLNSEGVEEVDSALETWYMNSYGYPLNSAKLNMSTLSGVTADLNGTVLDINNRLTAISNGVEAYEAQEVEDKTLDPTDGSPGSKGAFGGPSSGTDSDARDPEDTYADISGDGSGNGTGDTNPFNPTDTEDNSENDGKSNLNIDTNGDGIPDINIDTNGDGKADLNIDTDGDLIPDINIDTNNDGKADLNIDTNGNKLADINIDTNGDGKADLNVDTNGDRVPDINIDTNGDGKADVNLDTNGDGIPDVNIDKNGDGRADVNIDSNGDGKADLNLDSNGDGRADTNIDINNDGKPDINIDEDGDGKPDKNVIPGYEHNNGSSDKPTSFIDGLLGNVKFEVDDDGNVIYYDENGNLVYPFLGDGIFSNPTTAQKFKAAENTFLEMLDGPRQGQAVKSIDLDIQEEVASASLALGGMAALGAASANAATNMKRTKDEINDGVRVYDYDYDDDQQLTSEQYKKRKNGTIISVILLTLMIIGNGVASILDFTSDVTIVLLGLSIAITAIITSMGIKFGKFYSICAVLLNLLMVYIMACLGITSSMGYVIAFAVVVVVLLYYYFTKIFERILPMFDYVPAVVAIVGICFTGLLSVFEVTAWWLNLIFVLLIIAGYFAYNYFGIAQLEEQMAQDKKKGLNVYDYVNVRTKRVSVPKTTPAPVQPVAEVKQQDTKNNKKNNNSKFFN